MKRRPRVELTPELLERLLPIARSGATLAACAASVGIRHTTLDHWRQRGREAALQFERGEGVTLRDEKYLHLYRALEKARAELEIELLSTVRRMGLHGASRVTRSRADDGDMPGEETNGRNDTWTTQRLITQRQETHQQTWQAVARMLERLWPEKFGRRYTPAARDGRQGR
jgi:hypothetical protein